MTNEIHPYRVLYFSILGELVDLTVLTNVPAEVHLTRGHLDRLSHIDIVHQPSMRLRLGREFPVHVPVRGLSRISNFAPDVLIAGELGLRTVHGVLAARSLDVPLVGWATLSEHTERHVGLMRRGLRRWIARNVDLFFVNGESGARYVRRLGGRVHVTGQALGLTPPPQLSHSGRSGVLTVGRLSQQKGLVAAVSGWQKFESSTHKERYPEKWTFVGAGPLRGWLEVATARLQTPVDLRGFVPYERLPAYYSSAMFTFFPTLSDEWGHVVVESMAFGTPVLGSIYSQAAVELISNGANGWLFDPCEPASILDALDRASKTTAGEYSAMQRASRQAAQAYAPRTVAIDAVRRLELVVNG